MFLHWLRILFNCPSKEEREASYKEGAVLAQHVLESKNEKQIRALYDLANCPFAANNSELLHEYNRGILTTLIAARPNL